jgi:uncharacterized membrane protein YdfJ with MMPL/SSD domain
VRINAITDLEPRSPEGLEQVVALRSLDVEVDEYLIGGGGAYYTDSQQGIEQALPVAALWVFISTFILLFLFTGSLVLPLKAIVLNVLSLGAVFGLIGWIFQNGELQWLIGEYSVTGTIDTSSVVMIALVAFGLSMDYELFLTEPHQGAARCRLQYRELGCSRATTLGENNHCCRADFGRDFRSICLQWGLDHEDAGSGYCGCYLA